VKTRCVARSSLALALALAPVAAFAWGPTGHRVVARIAERHLSEAAARGVAAILGAESLVQAATWPDEIRSDPAWDKAKPWHFISLDDNETYETAPKSPDGDVVEALPERPARQTAPGAGRRPSGRRPQCPLRLARPLDSRPAADRSLAGRRPSKSMTRAGRVR
jgi:hypothetical protein